MHFCFAQLIIEEIEESPNIVFCELHDPIALASKVRGGQSPAASDSVTEP